MVCLNEARSPEGLRLYALGDVHGCLDDLRRRHAAILADLAANPATDWRIILLGDLIDRGPNSPGVLDWVCAQMSTEPRMLCVRGNHDTYLMEFLRDPSLSEFDNWVTYGGEHTIAQYGVDLAAHAGLGSGARAALHADLTSRVPQRHATMLESLPLTHVYGDFLFVHAGIRPGIALEAQSERDLIWIREPFLSWTEPHAQVVVHGHTPAKSVEAWQNRIGLDTGLVYGGDLSCLVLDGAQRWLLNDDGRGPVPDLI